jgi:hypothetical protein
LVVLGKYKYCLPPVRAELSKTARSANEEYEHPVAVEPAKCEQHRGRGGLVEPLGIVDRDHYRRLILE